MFVSLTSTDSGICYWESLIKYTSFNSDSRIIERESKKLLVLLFREGVHLAWGQGSEYP